MHVARFGAGDDQRVFGHNVAQRAQLLFQQRQRFRYANQHHRRRRRQLGQLSNSVTCSGSRPLSFRLWRVASWLMYESLTL